MIAAHQRGRDMPHQREGPPQSRPGAREGRANRPIRRVFPSWYELTHPTTSSPRIASSHLRAPLSVVAALELDPTDLTSLARLGKQAFIRANTTEALEYYGNIINREPRIYHEYAYLDVGLIYWKGGTSLSKPSGPIIATTP